MADLDKFAERITRGVARGTSRRSLLAWLGGAATGAAVFPVLPVSRASAQSSIAASAPCGRLDMAAGAVSARQCFRAIRKIPATGPSAIIGVIARSTASCARAAEEVSVRVRPARKCLRLLG